MTVNEVLCNAYEPRFNNLLEHLEKDGIKSQVQPPFLLGIERFTEEGNKTGNEEWYTNANLKVMFFGRETHIWGWDEESSVSDGCVEQYEKFYGRNYREVNDGNKRGVFFLVDSEDKLSKTPFFATGLNGIMSGIPQFRNPTNSLRSLRSKPPRMRFLLFKQAFCHILTDMSA